MSLLPTLVNEQNANQKKANKIEYEIDFETGQLTGGVVEGLEALKIWIWCVLKVHRYRFIIYSWDYGNEIENLIGQSHSMEYLESEVKREVTSCLKLNKEILEITDFLLVKEKANLNVDFKIISIYGQIDIDNYALI